MAGGIGSRFWPLSRNLRPKQFLDILGVGRTFLQQTFDRFSSIIPKENILVVTAIDYKELVKEQLPDILEENILLEPFKRNTAPCIAYASTKIYKRNPKAIAVVTPSDHFISNESAFLNTILRLLDCSSVTDDLFTLGIEPTRPETAYGYIQMNNNERVNIEGNLAYGVKTFTEKPNLELAKVFIDSGEFLWNSGIFVWNIKAILEEMSHLIPEIYNLFDGSGNYYYTQNEQSFINQVYENCPALSIDYGVMEKTAKAKVCKASFGWSDLGTWESLYMHCKKDENNNLIGAEEYMIDKIYNSIVVSTEKDKLIAIKGLDNYMIVNTEDVLMICPRDEVRFKNMLTDLTVKGKQKFQ